MRTFHQGWLAYLGLLSYFSTAPIATECIAETDSPTFNQDVAAIVHSKCSSCHRPGQAGPFSLLSYKDVARRAQTIEAVIDSGYMPPWKPVNHEIAFSNDRRLTHEEKELLRLWIANGLPRGSGQPPLPPKFSDGWQLGPPDKVIQMLGEFKVPASGPDIYRSFVFPLQLPDDKWVKAIEYRPTATSAVHHAIFFLDQQGNARSIDGSDGKAGIAGMSFLSGTSNLEDIPSGSAGSWLQGANKLRSTSENEPFSQALNRGLGGYVPGSTPNRLPGDLAMHLPAGSDIVMQTHFHPSGKTEKEQGRIALYFADKPPSRQLVPIQIPAMFGVGMGLKIPAGESAYLLEDSFVSPVDIELVSIGGHAHYICREAKMTAELPDGEERTLLDIDDWDLDWQDRYYFEKPIKLPAGTKLHTKLVYDNSTNNPENPNSPPREIRWGRQSGDEMGSITVQVVATSEEDRVTLQAALAKYFMQSLTRGDIVDLLMQLDTNGDGGLDKDEAPARLGKRLPLLDRNRNGKLEPIELQVLRVFMSSTQSKEK